MAGVKNAVKVLGAWPSPFVMRTRFALNIKKVKYEVQEECVFEKSELLLKSNPVYKKIPVLLHGDRAICESLHIVEYIDGVWSEGAPIIPSDPYDRYLARFWATVIDDKVFPPFMAMAKAKSQEEAGNAIGQICESLALLEEAFPKCSKGKTFFGGENIGYLDIALGCFIGWIRAAEKMANMPLIAPANTPFLAAWANEFCAHEAAREVVPETEKMMEFFQMFKAKMVGAASPSN